MELNRDNIMSKNKHIEDNPFSPYEDQDSLLKSLMASAKSAGVPEELINGINENLALALQDADETTSPKDLFLASYREELEEFHSEHISLSVIGTPYDPTLDVNWQEIPPSFLKGFKAIYNENYRALDSFMLDEIVTNVVFNILSSSLAGCDLARHVNQKKLKDFYMKSTYHSFKIKSKKANRFLKRALIPYDSLMLKAIDKNPNNLILDKVFKIDKLKDLIHKTQHLFEKGLEFSPTAVMLNKLALKSFYDGEPIPRNISSRIKLIGLDDLSTELVSRILTLIENKIELQSSITALWTISKLLDNDLLFFIAYAKNEDRFNKSDFPFLNFEILNAYDIILHTRDDEANSPSIINTMFSGVFMNAFIGICNSNLKMDEKIAKIKSELKNDCYNELGKPDFGLVIDECIEKHIELLRALPLPPFLEIKNDVYQSYQDKSQAFIDSLLLINKEDHDYETCIAIMDVITNPFNSLKPTLSEKLNEFRACENSLAGLKVEATALGENPLDNIESLIKLKDRKKHLEDEMENIKVAASNAIEECIVDLESKTKAILDNLQPRKSEVDKIKGKLQEEVKTLEAELEDAYYEIEQQKQKVAKLNAQVNHGSNIAHENSHTVPFDSCGINTVVSSILEDKCELETIFSLVDKFNPGKMVFSKKAKKSLKGIKHFQNYSSLFNKLNTLVSDEFTTAYTTKGSVEAFNFLSRNELSFQESESVKSKNIRSYHFEDYGTLDCKAHLKIGINNLEQHMLRIYFTIQQGKVLIGEVTRHLKCS